MKIEGLTKEQKKFLTDVHRKVRSIPLEKEGYPGELAELRELQREVRRFYLDADKLARLVRDRCKSVQVTFDSLEDKIQRAFTWCADLEDFLNWYEDLSSQTWAEVKAEGERMIAHVEKVKADKAAKEKSDE